MTRAARAAAENEPVEHVVALLRERLYGAISCLATLAVLARSATGLVGVGVLVLGIKILAH